MEEIVSVISFSNSNDGPEQSFSLPGVSLPMRKDWGKNAWVNGEHLFIDLSSRQTVRFIWILKLILHYSIEIYILSLKSRKI